jgi:hypothetical protein
MMSVNHLKTPVFLALLQATLAVKTQPNRCVFQVTHTFFTSV